MIKIRTIAAAIALIVPLSVALPAASQENPKHEDPVLVRINGYEIRVSEATFAATSIADKLAKVPPKDRLINVINYLVERHLLAQKARKEGIEDDPEYKAQLEYYKAKAARDSYFVTRIQPQITDQYVRSEYDRQKAAVDNKPQYHFSNIQVQDEAKAKEVYAALKGGADFAKLANENTADGGVQNGGDLGWFSKDEMDPQIKKAAETLKDGEFSEPVKTVFGWTIFKLMETKISKAKPFEELKEGLKLLLTRKRVQEIVKDLEAKAKIEVVHPDLKHLKVGQE